MGRFLGQDVGGMGTTLSYYNPQQGGTKNLAIHLWS